MEVLANMKFSKLNRPCLATNTLKYCPCCSTRMAYREGQVRAQESSMEAVPRFRWVGIFHCLHCRATNLDALEPCVWYLQRLADNQGDLKAMSVIRPSAHYYPVTMKPEAMHTNIDNSSTYSRLPKLLKQEHTLQDKHEVIDATTICGAYCTHKLIRRIPHSPGSTTVTSPESNHVHAHFTVHANLQKIHKLIRHDPASDHKRKIYLVPVSLGRPELSTVHHVSCYEVAALTHARHDIILAIAATGCISRSDTNLQKHAFTIDIENLAPESLIHCTSNCAKPGAPACLDHGYIGVGCE